MMKSANYISRLQSEAQRLAAIYAPELEIRAQLFDYDFMAGVSCKTQDGRRNGLRKIRKRRKEKPEHEAFEMLRILRVWARDHPSPAP